MSQGIKVKDLEKRINRVFYEDGLLELMIGVYLFFVGGALYVDSGLAPFTVLVIFFFPWVTNRLKERYIFPRIGYVKLKEDKEVSRGVLYGLFIFLGLLIVTGVSMILILGADTGFAVWINRIVPLVVGVMLSMGPIHAASTFGIGRMYFFAILFVISGIIAPFLQIGSVYQTIGVQMTVISLLLLLTGLVLFMQFLRRYPVLEENLNHG